MKKYIYAKHRIDHIKSNLSFDKAPRFKSKIMFKKSDVQLIHANILEKTRSNHLTQNNKWDNFRINRS